MKNQFNISEGTLVVTSTYVTADGRPILEVSREDDEEGGSLWQFHCGNGDFTMERMQLVRLDTILKIDPTVLDIPSLEMGNVAVRFSKFDPWKVK
jgi:hypothetical protein